MRWPCLRGSVDGFVLGLEQVCTERNVHSRSLDEVTKAVESLEAAPPAFLRLDLAPLFQPAQPSEPDAQTTSANNGSDTSMASQVRCPPESCHGVAHTFWRSCNLH